MQKFINYDYIYIFKKYIKNLITDLKNLNKNNKISAKVCIIGGGTVGLFLAHRLRLSRIPVTIVEAGGDQHNKLENSIYRFKNNSYNKFKKERL